MIRFHFGWDNSLIGNSLLIIDEPRVQGSRPLKVATVEWVDHDRGVIPGPETRLEVPDGAALQLAQQLWDLGHRPKDALNHEGEIRHLRSEIEFLRGLLATSTLMRDADAPVSGGGASATRKGT